LLTFLAAGAVHVTAVLIVLDIMLAGLTPIAVLPEKSLFTLVAAGRLQTIRMGHSEESGLPHRGHDCRYIAERSFWGEL
jgi:hypothetical protein